MYQLTENEILKQCQSNPLPIQDGWYLVPEECRSTFFEVYSEPAPFSFYVQNGQAIGLCIGDIGRDSCEDVYLDAKIYTPDHSDFVYYANELRYKKDIIDGIKKIHGNSITIETHIRETLWGMAVEFIQERQTFLNQLAEQQAAFDKYLNQAERLLTLQQSEVE